MNLFSRLRRFIEDERGVTAALVAVSLTATIGLTAAAVDLGMIYVAKGELQNAADAAALAAANTMISYDTTGRATAATGTALSTARTISGANQAIGINVPLKNPAGSDFVIGYWDTTTGDFDPNRTGMGIINPDDLTGVRVKIRRDQQANTPVSTYFAGIVGLRTANVAASSTALLGYSASVPAGTVDLPIAVSAGALTNGDQPNCGESLTFHSENTENSEWTTFFTSPANNPNVDAYITGELQIPELKIGDALNVINGNLSNNTFDDLASRFQSEATNGQWTVILPVVTWGANATVATVTGFCTFTITEVRGAPEKDLTGHLECQMVIPNSNTGGGNYGSRATAPKMVK
jgi:Flp pilus assembly protein TadG